MGLNQECNKVQIDVSIANNRIKELTGMKEMTYKNLESLISDKQEIERENQLLEQKIHGKGISEEESKKKTTDAEKEQIKKIRNSLDNAKAEAEMLMERLKVEETKGQEMLNERINLQQNLITLEEDKKEASMLQDRNREELIRLRIKVSQLISSEERLVGDLRQFDDENRQFQKRNHEYEIENEELNKKIAETIQKVIITI